MILLYQKGLAKLKTALNAIVFSIQVPEFNNRP